MSQQPLGGVPEFHYFDLKPFGGLAGRGGAVRFTFLRHDIECDEKLVPWGCVQATEAQNPAGQLPVIVVGDLALSEHHAIMRYIEKKMGTYGGDDVRDYYVDRIASASNAWRDLLIDSLFDPAAKTKFVEKRPSFYKIFSKHIELASGCGAFTVGSAGSYADDLVFAVLWDDTRKYGEDMLEDYPVLKTFFEEYRKHPAIDAWLTAASS